MLDKEQERLIMRLLDDHLPAEELSRAGEVVTTDERSVDFYLSLIELDSLLEEAMACESVPAELLVASPTRLAPFLAGLIAVAVVLAVGVLVSWQVLVDGRVADVVGEALPDRAPEEAPLPEVAAVLVDVTGDGSVTVDGKPFTIGSKVRTTETVRVELPAYAEFEVGHGVRLLVKGRTEFIVRSRASVDLVEGSLMGIVPLAARGFQVTIPGGEVRDLGTSFAVATNASQQTVVTVLEGEVHLEQSTGEGPRRTLALGVGQSGRLDQSAGLLETLPRPPPELGEIMGFDAGIIEMTGAARFHSSRPSLLWEADRRRSNEFQVFKECSNLLLAHPLRVGIDDDSASQSVIPAGTRVDSYLLRFDPAGPGRGALNAEATLTFRQRILGVIGSSDLLMQSDSQLAPPDVADGWPRQTRQWRQRRGMDREGDAVHTAEDRRTLGISLRAGLLDAGFDELRILTVPVRSAEPAATATGTSDPAHVERQPATSEP